MFDDDVTRMDKHVTEANSGLEMVKHQIRLATEVASDLYRDVGGAAANEGTARMFSRWFEELETAVSLADQAQEYIINVALVTWRLSS